MFAKRRESCENLIGAGRRQRGAKLERNGSRSVGYCAAVSLSREYVLLFGFAFVLMSIRSCGDDEVGKSMTRRRRQRKEEKGKCAPPMDDREARARALLVVVLLLLFFRWDHPPIGTAAGVPDDIYLVRAYIYFFVVVG